MDEECEALSSIFMDEISIGSSGSGGREISLFHEGNRVLTLTLTGELCGAFWHYLNDLA